MQQVLERDRAYITIKEASQELGVARQTLIKWLSASNFPLLKIDKKVLINKDAFRMWQNSHMR